LALSLRVKVPGRATVDRSAKVPALAKPFGFTHRRQLALSKRPLENFDCSEMGARFGSSRWFHVLAHEGKSPPKFQRGRLTMLSTGI
jgi:hypothetical protein